MAAFWMCELAPTEIAGSDAFNRNQLACRTALTYDRASKVGGDSVPRRMLRVLIIDDEQDTTDGLVRQILRWGHAACCAYDGASGLKMAAAQHPDVVVLDVAMPFMDGRQVARQLRLDFPKQACFVIAITGIADEECRQQCNEAGIDLVLVKPIQPSVLEALLMLECARMNRCRSDLGLAQKGASKLTRKRVGAEARDGSAIAPRIGIATATATGRQL